MPQLRPASDSRAEGPGLQGPGGRPQFSTVSAQVDDAVRSAACIAQHQHRCTPGTTEATQYTKFPETSVATQRGQASQRQGQAHVACLGGVQNCLDVFKHDPLHGLPALDGVLQEAEHVPHKPRALYHHHCVNVEGTE